MKRAVVTGMNGTLAPVLAEFLKGEGVEVIPWDREMTPIDDRDVMIDFFEQEGPDGFFHLATGPADWAEEVARLCYRRSIRFLFTSSVSVFDSAVRGPIAIDRIPDATDDYGKYKIECEARILAVNRVAMIARLGWLMHSTRGGNHMLEQFWQQQESNGKIEASTAFIPGCIYLEDAAEALYKIMRNNRSDTFHIDGNSRSLSLFEIAAELNRLQKGAWDLQPLEEPVLNTRMPDPRIEVPSIFPRLNKPAGPVFIEG